MRRTLSSVTVGTRREIASRVGFRFGKTVRCALDKSASAQSVARASFTNWIFFGIPFPFTPAHRPGRNYPQPRVPHRERASQQPPIIGVPEGEPALPALAMSGVFQNLRPV